MSEICTACDGRGYHGWWLFREICKPCWGTGTIEKTCWQVQLELTCPHCGKRYDASTREVKHET